MSFNDNFGPFPDTLPALPVPCPWPQAGIPGITLRDWFAGMALQGMLAYSHVGPNGNYHENCSTGTCVDCAYQYADAMMEQRQRPATSGKE